MGRMMEGFLEEGDLGKTSGRVGMTTWAGKLQSKAFRIATGLVFPAQPKAGR